MAKSSVKLDYDELKKLKDQIMKFGDQTQVDQFMESCAKELAARLLAKVIKRTPVGQYPAGSGKVGGTLRRGWTSERDTSDGEKQAMYENLFGGGQRVTKKAMTVEKVGNDYVIEIINPVSYASYVEYGHRTKNHRGWVEGKFMLTISEDEIRRAAPGILEKKLKKYLKECFK